MMTGSSSEAALHEYADAEITVTGLSTPVQEKTVHEVLEKLPGVRAVSVRGDTVSVNYEPVCVAKSELIAAIRGAGFPIAEEHATPSSPMTDAFADAPQPGETQNATQGNSAP